MSSNRQLCKGHFLYLKNISVRFPLIVQVTRLDCEIKFGSVISNMNAAYVPRTVDASVVDDFAVGKC